MSYSGSQKLRGLNIVAALLLALFASPGLAQETVNQTGDKVDDVPTNQAETAAPSVLVEELGYSVEALASESSVDELIAQATSASDDATAKLGPLNNEAVRNSAKVEFLDEQLTKKVTQSLRGDMVRTGASLRVFGAILAATSEGLKTQKKDSERRVGLLEAHREGLAKTLEEAVDSETAKVEREAQAEQAEADAVLAVEQAKAREERERDETIKRLLKRETELAEASLAETREHNSGLEAVTGHTVDLEKSYAAEKGDLLEKSESRASEPSERVSEQIADQMVARAIKSRRAARSELLVAYGELGKTKQEFKEHRSSLSDARESLIEEEGREEALNSSDLWQRRMAVARAEVELQSKRVDNDKAKLLAWKQRREVVDIHLGFLDQTLADTLQYTSSSGARESYRLSDSNVSDVFDGATVMYHRVAFRVASRLEQLTDIDVTVDLFTWIGGLFFKFIPLILVFFLLSFWSTGLPRVYRSAITIRMFRRRPAVTLLGFELLYFLAKPVALLFAIQYIITYVVTDVWLLAFLPDLVDAVFFYLIARDTVSVLFEPRTIRDPNGEFNQDFRLTFQERAFRVFEMTDAHAVKVVRSTKVFVSFWILASLIPTWVEAALGIGVLWRWVSLIARWGLFGVGFWTISKWRDEIADLFVKLAADRLPLMVRLVQEHRDRFYGVVIIAFASVYVIAVELGEFGKRYVLQSEWFKTARNFAFRKRIELQQREREEEEEEVENQELPASYLDLFTDFELDEDDVIVKRQAYLDKIIAAEGVWQQSSKAGSIALVGEDGVGRSTLMKAVCREADVFAGMEVTSVKVHDKAMREKELILFLQDLFDLHTRFESTDELIQHLTTLERRVIVLDDCHHFYMRRIGGFDALDALLNIMTLTDHHHFWILSFSKNAWDYFNRVRTRVHQFGHVINLAPWTEEELQQLIEFRNARVEYALDFSGLVTSESAESDDFYEVVKSAKGYFRYLHEFCGGNPRVGILYWLRSLTLRADGTLCVALFRRPTTADFEKFTDNHWFVLTALAQHGSLRATEVATVINADPGFCVLAFNYLADLDLLTIDRESGRAKLAPLYFRQVLKRLANNNFLYT